MEDSLSKDAVEITKLEKECTEFPRLTKEQQNFLILAEEKKPKCSSCKFWRWTFKSVGECRYYPPTKDGLNSGKHPFTNLLHWCGKHEFNDCVV